MSFVVDASVAAAWLFEDEVTEATDALLEGLDVTRALAPGLWPYEVANLLLTAERRGRISEAQVRRLTESLRALPIDVQQDEPAAIWVEATAVGRRHGLTAYDAAYLELAMRRGVALATLDKALRDAARRAGVKLLPE